MKAISKIAAAVICGILVLTAPAAVAADRGRAVRPARPAHPVRPWHGDIHRFRQQDLSYWRGGHWYHGVHRGHFGWWWVIPGVEVWYLYSVPIYPYPDPYMPPVVTQQTPPQFWYYCRSAQNYYPYVATCPEGWQKVPATPPDTGNRRE